MRRRSHDLKIRMNDDEYKLLTEKLTASGETLNSYGINALLGENTASAEYIRELQSINENLSEFNRQIRGIATNVNQMAHHANITGYAAQRKELEELSEIIESIREEMNPIWRSIRQLTAGHRLMPH